MSDHPLQSRSDIIMTLYDLAEALKHIATTLPEEMAGLAFILHSLARSIKMCAEKFDSR